MSKIHLRSPYMSGWFTVILPTLEFLLVWIGLSVLIFALLDWNLSDWLGMLICGVNVVVGLAVCVVTYPFLLRLAQGGQGELELDGGRIRWRTGRRWREIDLTQPYHAEIAAGASGLGEANASVSITQGNNLYLAVHFHRARRQDILRCFPEPYFVDELAVTPQEGSWGFDMEAGDPAVSEFAAGLLEVLWRQRHHNQRFTLYARFPWDRLPQPAFHTIRLIERGKCTPQEEAFIEGLKHQLVDGLTDSYVRATPDYLLGWVYRSFKSHVSGIPDYYCVMPLGYVTAEVSMPRPDWKPFIIGHVLKEALAGALGTTAPSGGPYLQDRRYLYLRGRGDDGKSLELAFDWYGPGDSGYEEAEMLVRFIRAMSEQVRADIRNSLAS